MIRGDSSDWVMGTDRQEAVMMIANGSLRLWLSAAACGCATLLMAGCGGSKPPVPTASLEAGQRGTASPAASATVSYTSAPVPVRPKIAPLDPIVIIHTSEGDLKVQLYLQKAPQTVDNFIRNYVARGFYEQTIFHHVDKNSMIAAGGFTQDFQAKPSRAPVYNESSNGLKNTRGSLAMARDPDVAHSATSQFFFNLVDNSALDYVGEATDAEFGYCVFGQVLEGLDVLDKIAQKPVTAQGDFPAVPEQAVVILSMEQVQ